MVSDNDMTKEVTDMNLVIYLNYPEQIHTTMMNISISLNIVACWASALQCVPTVQNDLAIFVS